MCYLTPEREELLNNISRFVYGRAHVLRRTRQISLDEAFSAGMEGAMYAAKRFDFSRGIKFLSYAKYWIDVYIQRCNYARFFGNNIDRYRGTIRPSLCIVSSKRLGGRILFRTGQVSSTKRIIDQEFKTSVSSIVKSVIYASQIKEKDRAWWIISNHYGLDNTPLQQQRDIAAQLGMTYQRVQQTVAKIFKLIKADGRLKDLVEAA